MNRGFFDIKATQRTYIRRVGVFKMKIFGIYTLVVVALHLRCSALGVFRSCGGFLSAPKGVLQSQIFRMSFQHRSCVNGLSTINRQDLP